MTPTRSIRNAILIASTLAAAPLHAQSGSPDTLVYALSSDSQFEYGCFGPCECPVLIRSPMVGSFQLAKTGSDPLFDHYAVSEVRWRVADAAQPISIAGSGTYRRGGEFALVEQLTLDLSFNGGQVQHFDSGLLPPQAPFPAIHTSISLHQETHCSDSVLVVVAKPLSSASAEDGARPASLTAAPNPFGSSTEVSFVLPHEGPIDLGVFDVTGREVRSLARAEWLAAGRHARIWDGILASGNAAPPGLYFIRLRSGTEVRSRVIAKLE